MKNLIILIYILMNSFFSFSQNNALAPEKGPGDILWYHYVTGVATKSTNPVLTPEENIIWVRSGAGMNNADIICNQDLCFCMVLIGKDASRSKPVLQICLLRG